MKAYKNIRFIEYPDIADILEQGRKSSVGKLKIGEIMTRYRNNVVSDDNMIISVNRNSRGYCSSKKKRVIRRYLKRRDRKIEINFQIKAEIDY